MCNSIKKTPSVSALLHTISRAATIFTVSVFFYIPLSLSAESKYAQLFKELEELGAGNVTNMNYINLDSNRPFSSGLIPPLPMSREFNRDAWLIKETSNNRNKDRIAHILFNGACVANFVYGNVYDQEDKHITEQFYGKWSKANIRTSIQKVYEIIDNHKSSYDKLYCDDRGKLCIFALRLHQMGLTEDSDRIIREIDEIAQEDDGEIIDESKEALADSLYESAYYSFLINADWNSFEKALKDLKMKFPEKWKNAPVIDYLIKKIEERKEGIKIKLNNAENLTARDIQLAKELLEIYNMYGFDGGYNRDWTMWLLPETWATTLATNNTPDLLIKSKGIHAIPLLLALKDEQTLTQIDYDLIKQEGSLSFNDFHNKKTEQEIFQEQLHSLPHPASIGDVAKAILKQIQPKDFASSFMDKTDFTAEAEKIYKKFKDASQEDIAVEYLRKSDNHYIIDAAMDIILKKAQYERVPSFERYIIESYTTKEEYELYSLRPQFIMYLTMRKSNCNDLIPNLSNTLKEMANNYKVPENVRYQGKNGEDLNGVHAAEMKAQYNKIATSLKKINFATSTEDLIKKALIAGSTIKGSDLESMILTRMKFMPPHEAVQLLIKNAAESITLTQRSTASYLTSQLIKEVLVNNSTNINYNTSSYTEENKQNWESLINDETYFTTYGATIGDIFLCLNEDIFSGIPKANTDNYFSFRASSVTNITLFGGGIVAQDMINTYGAKGRKLVENRVSARIDGATEKKLPPYPYEKKLSTNEFEELRQKFVSVKNQGSAAKLMQELSVYEIAEIPNLLSADNELSRKTSSFANIITSVNIKADENNKLKQFQTWKNTIINTEKVEELRTFCIQQALKPDPVECIITRRKNFLGCDLTIHSISEAEIIAGRDKVEDDPATICGVSALIVAKDVYAAVQWRTAPIPEKTGWWMFLTSNADDMRAYKQAVMDFCQSIKKPSTDAFIRFIVKGNPQCKSKLKKNTGNQTTQQLTVQETTPAF